MVQCLGGFGLLMVFLVIGWISVAESLDGVVTNLNGVFQSTGVVSTMASINFKSVLDILTKIACVIHYTFGFPILILLFHSFLYVCTYSEEGKKDKVDAESAFTALKNVINQFKGLLVGVILTMKFCLMFFQFLLCFTLEHLGQTENVVYINQFRTSVFLIFVGCCFILSPFSTKLLKLRHKIFKSFYGSTKKSSSKKAGNMLWKKTNQISNRDVKMRRHSAKTKVDKQNRKIAHIKKRLSRTEDRKLRKPTFENKIEEFSSDEACVRGDIEKYQMAKASFGKKGRNTTRNHKLDVVVDMYRSDSDSSESYSDNFAEELKNCQIENPKGCNELSQESDTSENGDRRVNKNDPLSFLYR